MKHIKLINNILLIILTILIIMLCKDVINKLYLKSYKEYSKNMIYMDTYINVKIYSNKNADKVLEQVDNIYKEYNDLCDKYNLKDKNLYYINNNEGLIETDKRLIDIINYGLSWYDKSNGLLNINLGSIIDVWAKYRENGSGIPTKEELQDSGSYNIKDIVIEDNKIKGNVNIDLGSIAKGYVTEIVGDYLKEKGFNNFIINAGGNVLLGDNYQNKDYIVGIQSPFGTDKIMARLSVKNKALVTSGGYERFYEYNGVRYSHIIDPNTLYPANKLASVTVISDSSKEADALSTILFLMSVKEGVEFIKDYNVDVIWVTLDNEVITTKGVYLYE